MARTLIQNLSTSAIALPLPYTGIIGPKSSVIVDDPAAYVVQQIMRVDPNIDNLLAIRAVSEAQPIDGHTRAVAATKITTAMAVTTTSLGMNGQRIVNVADPIDPQDVATKQYVDTHGGGGGGGGGTVTSITAGLGLTGGVITTSGVIAADFGTGAGKVTQGNDARLNPAPSAAGAIVYDNGTTYSKTAAGTLGQVLKVGIGGIPEWGADSTTPTGPAGGSLAGTYPNPTIAAGAITNTEVAAGAGILTSKLSGLLTDIPGNGLAAFLASGSKIARTYYVAVNGNNTTGNGSSSAPFATLQKAHDVAASENAAGQFVQILVGPGDFAGDLTITRHNTLFVGAGERPEDKATKLSGSVVVNPTTATVKTADTVLLAGFYIGPSGGATTPAFRVTGSGLFSCYVSNCYVTTTNATATANAIYNDTTNAQRPRLLVINSIVATQAAGATVVKLDAGDNRIFDSQVNHGSGVVAAAGSVITVASAATVWIERCSVDNSCKDPAIVATGASAGTKLLLTNSSVTCAYAGSENTTHGITVGNTTGLAAYIFQTAFSVADVSAGVYAINGSAPAVVSFSDISFLSGTNASLAPAIQASLVPSTEMHGTVNLPSLTASLPLQLDANKNVIAQALDVSNLSGVLAVSRGGTGIGSIAGNGTVAYSNGSTLAYTDVGLAGYPLLSTGAGKPAFSALDLSTAAVTGALPASKQASQTMGGDVTGTTAANTVVKIQNRDVSAQAPSAGQVLAWSGASWAPSTVNTGGGGGGGGLTIYMNYVQDGQAPLPAIGDKQLSFLFNTSGAGNTGAVTAPQGSYAKLAEFVTDVDAFGFTTIPPGLWSFNVYLLLNTGTDATFFRVRLFKWDGTTLTELATSPSDDVAVQATQTPSLHTADLYVEQAVLFGSERLVARIEVTRTTPDLRSVVGYFSIGYPSHIHSTLGGPSGTGIVRVVAGTIQTPATLLKNSDVDQSAGIDVFKLAKGAANTVLRGNGASNNAFGKVQLGSDVDGMLPVSKGGTGLNGGNRGGIPYFTQINEMGSSLELQEYEIVFGGGLGSAPKTAIGRGTGTKVLHGGAFYPTWDYVNLATDVTGVLPVANGGSGVIAMGSAGSIAYSDGSAFAFSSAGMAGQLLVSGGTGAPTWISTVSIARGGTNGTAIPTAGGIAYGTGSAYAFTGAGTTGQVLLSNGSDAPTWGTPPTPVVPYDIAGSVGGKPESSAVVFLFVVPRALTLSSTASDHLFRALIAATASTAFVVYKTAAVGGAKTIIGTATFGAGTASCTLDVVNSTSFVVGDYITIEAPLTPDSTLANIFWTLKGSA